MSVWEEDRTSPSPSTPAATSLPDPDDSPPERAAGDQPSGRRVRSGQHGPHGQHTIEYDDYFIHGTAAASSSTR